METLIIKYLNGTLTQAEEFELNLWLQEPKNQKVFQEMIRIQYHLDTISTDVNTTESYKSVLANIQIKSKNNKNNNKYFAYYLVASLLIGFFVANFLFFKKENSPVNLESVSEITLVLEDGTIQTIKEGEEKEVKRKDGSYVSTQNNDELSYSASSEKNKDLIFNTLIVPNGKTFRVVLSDGSRVVINSGTKFKYPIEFASTKERRVYLEGEAYFEVITNPAKPFIVETPNIDVKALGTGFNVTSYTADEKIYAVLVHGKIEVENTKNTNEKVVLKPNQLVDFSNNTLSVENVNPEKYIAWINGDLLFIGEPMQDVFNRLERKFDLKIINNSDRFDDIVLTAKFRNESIEDILKTFKAYTNFSYSVNSKTIYITNN